MCSVNQFEVIYCVTLVVRNHNTIHLYSERTPLDFNRTVKDFSLNDPIDVWVDDVPIGNSWCRNASGKRMYKRSTWLYQRKSSLLFIVSPNKEMFQTDSRSSTYCLNNGNAGLRVRINVDFAPALPDTFHRRKFLSPAKWQIIMLAKSWLDVRKLHEPAYW